MQQFGMATRTTTRQKGNGEQVSVLEVEKVALLQARKKGMQTLSLTLSLIQTLTLTKTRFPRLMLHRVETNGD